jgi:PAS domain S-box-containing protein
MRKGSGEETDGPNAEKKDAVLESAPKPKRHTRIEQAETQSEQAMCASELSYRRLFEAARDGILILDVDTGRISDVNPFLVELLGFSHAEMVGKTVGELSPFKDIESNKVMLERLQRDGYVRYEDLPLETRDGRHVAVEFVSNVYQAGDKKVIQCNIRDITERKRTELASIRLAAIIESSDDAIIGKDLNGVITSWNKGAEQIFGYSATEMMGTSIMRLIPADRQEEANQILGKIRSGKSVEHFETLRQTKDGRLIDVSVTASAIKDATGKAIGVSKVARNITERKRAEKKMHNIQAQLEQTNRNLTKRSQEIQYFYHTLSHELKTPLTAAREFVSIVIDGLAGELNATQLNYLGIAKKSCTELAVYINDLLDATRLDTGKLHIELKAVSLAAIIQRAIAVMEPVAARKKIRLSEELDTDLTDVMVDESRIMQILTNLLNNALKFTFEGGEIIVKLAEYSKSSECVQISVTDNGCGIPKDKIDNLFHRFYQIKNGDATPEKGVGLGLYLCRELVLMHRGSIWVESALGKGSTFSFTIPKEPATKTAHILVVDDDGEVREALGRVLKDNGFDVVTVAGGSEALQRIGQKTPDVVVLDLMMVGLDGPDTLKEIRKHLGPIPVIVHTGYPDGDLMQRVLESSPFTLLAKPCPPMRFVETVRRICHDNQPLASYRHRSACKTVPRTSARHKTSNSDQTPTSHKKDNKEVGAGPKASNDSGHPASISTAQRRNQ